MSTGTFCARRLLCMGVVAAALWGGLGWAEVANPHGVAVIIGNKDYARTVDVDFAHRDAEAFARYVVDVLGFDPEHVLLKRDAPLRWMFSTFGQPGHVEGTEIWRMLEPGKSDVVVFYSGHGVPGLRNRRGYLVPVDAEPDKAEFQAYSLDLLYENLGRLDARSVSVFVDSCFSGDSEAGMLFEGVSAVRSEAGLPEGENVTLMTAATGRQVALWDREAEHGLFTRHLLDGLYGDADADRDGRITAGEAKEYLDEHMTRAAREGPGRRLQTATLRGGEDKVLAVARFPGRSSPGSRAVAAELEQTRQELAAVSRERDRLAKALKAGEEALEQVGGERDALVQRHAELAREIEVQRRELAKAKSEQERLTGVVAEQEAELQPLRARVEREAAERERLRPGREFEDCPECPRMVVVPAGEYMMGSRSKEGTNDERPRHRVRIGKAFAVGKYEVTFAEWDACVAAGGCRRYRPGDRGWGRGKRPVVNVSWEDAKAYAGWLSEKTGKEYRLLSEAEWEYVTRARTETVYWWGDKLGDNRANCDGCGSRWDGKETAPVGSFSGNAFGLHDVHGNVWEWVEDCWHASYNGAPRNGAARVSGGDCSQRVLRGGSWVSNPGNLRSADRDRNSAWNRINYIGFRIARTLTP